MENNENFKFQTQMHYQYLTDDSFSKNNREQLDDLSTSDTEIQKFINDNIMSNQQPPQHSLKFLIEEIESSDCQAMREQSAQNLLGILNIQEEQQCRIIKKCTEHPDEDLLFVCYNCNMKSICIECISNGCQHNGHEIKNVKKAKPDVQILLDQYLLKLKRKIEVIAEQNDKVLVKKSELVEYNQGIKKLVHNQFQEVRELLNFKEKEVLNNISNLLGKRSKSLQELSVKLKRKMNIFIESHKVIEETVKKLGDQLLCQYYHKKQKDLQELVQDPYDYIQVDRTLEDLLTFKQEFQTESMKKIIMNFTSLQEEINGIKGMETIKTEYINSEKSFMTNTQIQSPQLSLIQDQPKEKQNKFEQFKEKNKYEQFNTNEDVNQTQKTQVLSASFLQKIDETVESRSSNGSYVKNPNNFLFSNIFAELSKQKEDQKELPYKKKDQKELPTIKLEYSKSSKSIDIQQKKIQQESQNLLNSQIITKYINESQKSKVMKTDPFTHRAKSYSIFQIDDKIQNIVNTNLTPNSSVFQDSRFSSFCSQQSGQLSSRRQISLCDQSPNNIKSRSQLQTQNQSKSQMRNFDEKISNLKGNIETQNQFNNNQDKSFQSFFMKKDTRHKGSFI